jgi:hypothetical protein
MYININLYANAIKGTGVKNIMKANWKEVNMLAFGNFDYSIGSCELSVQDILQMVLSESKKLKSSYLCI